MLPFFRAHRLPVALLLTALMAFWQIGQPLQAATFYWDTDTNTTGNDTNGTGLGGTGNWDLVTSNWWNLASLGVWPNTNADVAVFSSPYSGGAPTPFTVTLSSGIVANQLRFQRGGYTLTGGDLTLAGTTPALHANMGETAVIGSQILGTAGLVKTGGGSIRLTSANNYTGVTKISNGSLVISNPNQLNAATSAVEVTGGNLANPGNLTNFRGMGGGSLVLDGTGGGFTFTRDLSLQGQGPIGDRSAALISIGDNTISGTVTTGVLAPGSTTNLSTRLSSANGTLTLSGTLNILGTAATTIAGLGGAANQAGAGLYDLTGVLTGTGTLEKTGTGALFLDPSDTSGFSGTIRMGSSAASGQSSVRITSAGVLGTRTSTGTGAVLDMNTGTLEVRMDVPSVLAGGIPAHIYGRASSTLFTDHAPGSAVINGTVNLGRFDYEDGQTFTLNSRNGYGFAFGLAPVIGGNGNSVFTNNSGGSITFTGNFWSNTENTGNRTMTINGTGFGLVDGSVIASAGSFDHNLTKNGIGSWTIRGTASTLDGNVNINNGALVVTDFRSLTNNSGTINIGSNASNTNLTSSNNNGAGALVIGSTDAFTVGTATAAGLTTNKVINLAGTTNGASIYANQSGANPVIFNSAFTATGDGAKTLTLGGTSTVDNIINGAIVNSAANATSLTKIGPGTWVLAGTNSYTGTTNLADGTLKLNANGASSTALPSTNAITFSASNNYAGATFEFVGQASTNNVQNLGTLTYSAGANTLRLTPGSGGTASLVFANLATTGAATINIVGSNGTSNTVTLTQVNAAAPATGILTRSVYWNGADFAFSQAGLLRAPVYGTDTGTATTAAGPLTSGSNNQITGSFATNSISVATLKINGGHTLTVNSGQTLTLSGGGLLATGGNALVSGGTVALGSQAFVVRVNEQTDTLSINSVISGTGGLTKAGAGTLILSGPNTRTGTMSIDEGTLRLAAGGVLGGNNVTTNIRQGAVLDLGGVSTGNAIGQFNNNGIVTNSNATAATLQVGNNNGTGDSRGVIEDGLGVVSVTKVGTGNQNWFGASTYTGVTTIGSTGLVTVNVLADGDSASGIGASSSAAGNLVFSGSTGGLGYAGNITNGNLTLGSRSASTDRLFTLAGTGARLSSTASNNNAIVWRDTGAIVHGIVGPQLLTFEGTSTGDNTFNPKLTDSGTGSNITSVTKTGIGQWNLGNTNNTYTGITTVSNGILGLNDNGALPANSPLALGTTTTAGILQMSGTFTRSVVATATAGSGTVTWAGTTGGGGFAAHITPLVVTLNNDAITPLTWGADGFVGTGGTQSLLLNSASAVSEVVFANAINLNGAVRTVNVADNTSTGADFATMSGVLSGTGTSGLQKGGSGILRITGANTYAGVTDINTGTLIVSSLGHSSDAPNTPNSVGVSGVAFDNTNAITIGNGGTGGAILQYIGDGETSDRKIRFNSTTGGPQIHADGSGPLILTNVVNDFASPTGAKTLSLRGTNTAGNMITSILSNDAGGGVLNVGVDGGATWILTAANIYTGTTTAGAGALGIGNDSALGTGGLVLSNSNVFAYGADRTISNTVTHNNNTTQGFLGDYSLTFTAGLTAVAGANNFGTNNSIAAGKALTFNGVTANSLTATRAWTIDGTGTTIINGDITTSTAFGLNIVKTGNGTLQLNGTGGNFNQAGNNIDIDRGMLRLGASEVIPNAASTNGGLVFSPEAALEGDTATLDLNGFTETVNALTANTAGTVVIDNTAATAAALRFGANDAAIDFGSGVGSYTITDSGVGALSIVKLGTTSTTFSAGLNLTYEGATRVEGGSLTIASPLNGTNALQVVNSGSTLSLTGGLTTPSAITSVIVENGATLALLDGTGNKLTSLTSLQLGSSGGTMTSLNLNVGDLVSASGTPFDNGDDLATDTLTLLTGGTLSLFTGNQITFNLTDAGLNPNQKYELLNFVDGGFTTGPLANTDYLLGATPGGFSSIILTATDTSVFITTGNLIVGDLFWRGLAGGGTNDTWNGNANNWSLDKANTSVATSIPGQGTDVIFAIDNASGAVATTLEQNFKINSLTFEVGGTSTPTSVTIAPGAVATNRLEIAPQASADGLAISAGGPPAVTISAPLKIGTNQTWNVADAASILTLSGGLQGEADVTKSGSGKVIVSAAADPTFNAGQTTDFTINAGNLEIQNVGALGNAGNSNLATVTLNSTGGFYYNGTAGTVANNLTLAGGALSAGTGNQTYSGTVNVSSGSIINMADSNGPATNTARNITLSGVVSGSGSLTIDSNNGVSGGNQFNGTLTLNNAGNTWTGDLLFNEGTVTVSNAASPSFTTNNVAYNAFGRLNLQGLNGSTLTRTGTLTYGAGAIGEIGVDNTGAVVNSDFLVDQNGAVALGSGGTGGNVRIFLSDAFSKLNITGGVTLGGNSSISVGGDAAGVAIISSVISDGGSGYGLAINDDAGGWGTTNRTVRLTGSNTFTGNVTLGEGVLEFNTVTDISGGASSLGNGTAILTTGTGTLRFIGTSAQSTNRPITTSGAALTLSANGATATDTITYNGAITVGPTGDGSQIILTGAAGREGIIAGGIAQTGDTADATVNGGTWTHQTGTSRIGDDLTLTGANSILNLNSGLFQVRDDFTVTANSTLNLGGAGVLSFSTATLSADASLRATAGGVINLGANDAVVVTDFDGLRIGTDAAGVGTLNTGSFSQSVSDFILGNRNMDRSGLISGSGTITVTNNIDLYGGMVNANLASSGAVSLDKISLNTVTLAGDNSGLAGTGSTVVTEGTLILDYSASNTTKLRAASALDMRGSNLTLLGNASAATSQSVGSFTLGSGGNSTITLTPNGQDLVLNLNAITRAVNAQDGTVRFDLPSGAQSITNGITTDTLNTLGTGTNAILGGWATVNDGTGVFFARNLTNAADGNIVAAVTTSQDAAASWLTGENITDSAGFTGSVSVIALNSLRFNAASGSDLSLASNGVLGLTSGGLLVTSNVGGTPSLVNGTLFSGAVASNVPELIFTQDSAATFELGSDIRINHAVTKSGAGTLLLTGDNTYTGVTEIQNGVLQVGGGSAIGDTSVVVLSAARQSTFELLASETIGRLAGGSRNTDQDLGTVAIGSHTLTLNGGANTTYAGFFTGSGNLVMNSGYSNNFNLTNVSSGFTGEVVISGGLFQLSGIGQINASGFTINKGGNLLIDNNGTTRSGARILDGASITLNSADGAFSGETRPRGLAIRTDQDTTLDETVGVITAASGANYVALAASTTNDDSDIIMSNLVRTNRATLNVRGTNLGGSSAQENEFRIGDATNQTNFIATLIGGGGAAASQTISIVPWAIGESFAGALGDGNMGNSLVTYVSGSGFRPLDFATEYDTLGSAAANENARESLAADLVGVAGKTINALVIDNNNTATVNVTGSGAGQTLTNTSGAFLFTVSNGAVSTAYSTILGGFDDGIEVGGGEYVFHVVNPSSANNTATLTATVSSPLDSTADITKSGRGTLIFTAANTAGGGSAKTTLNEGTLQISSLANIGGTSGALVFAGGTLRLAAGFTDDISQRAISFLSGGGTLDTNGNDLALAGSMGSGIGNFTKTGAGNLTLNGASAYTGATVLSAGTITIGANNATGNGGNLSLAGGTTLALGTNSLTQGLVTTAGASPAITGTGTITASTGFFFNHTGDTTIDAVLAGAGGLLKAQANVVTLTGASTYMGTTEIQAGTLSINSIANVGGGASALGAPTTAEAGIIRMGLSTAATTLQYTGSGHSTNRLIGMQGTTGSVTIDADGTGALGLGGVRFEMAGNKTLVLRGSSDALTIDNTTGTITETGGVLTLNKTDANTWLVNAAASYTGATQVDNGTLKIGLDNALPAVTAVRIGTGSTAGTLDLNGFDQTIGSLTVQTNNNAVTNNIIVGSGKTLTVNGAVTLGINANESDTNLNATGGGAIVINSGNANFQIGAATVDNENRVDVDFSGLNSFTANLGSGTFRLGDPNTGTGNSTSTFKLAVNNSITATSIRIGDGTGGSNTHTLALGSGTNLLNADTFNIGSAGATIRSGGAVIFDAGDTTGALTLRASNGTDRATVNMINTTGNTAGDMTSTLDLTGHTADILASTLSMATRSANTGAGTAILSFNQGTLDVSTLNMASRTGAGTGNATATVNLGDSAAPGSPTTTIGAVNMAVNTSGGGTVSADFNVTGGNVTIGTGAGTAINMANAGTGRTVTSTIDLTGGTVTVTGNIVRTGGAGTENATVTLDGAALNMSGNSIGAAGPTVTLAAQSGTLTNLAELNGGGALTKSTGGVLSMGDGNVYTGGTFVTGGTLVAANTTGSATGSGAVSVSSGATLGGTGSVVASAGNNITVDGTFSTGLAGDIAGQDMALTVSSTGNLTFNGTVSFDIFANAGGANPATANDRAFITAANWSNIILGGSSVLEVTTTLDTSSWADGDSWQIFDWTGIGGGTASGTFATFNLPTLTGLFWDYSNVLTTGTISISSIPEPSRALLLLLGLVALVGRRRREIR
jgi:autotransporter-associated beta strand protein